MRFRMDLTLIALLVFTVTIPVNAADTSLTIAEYQSRGVPDISRKWGTNDFVRAVTALQAIQKATPAALPRLESERSRPLFKKLVAAECVATLADDRVAYQERLKLTGQLVQAGKTLLDLYPSDQVEFFSLIVCQLRIHDAANGFLEREVRRREPEIARKTIRETTDHILDALPELLLELQSELAAKQPQVAADYAKGLGEVLPRIWPRIEKAEHREALTAIIEAISDVTENREVRLHLQRLARTLKPLNDPDAAKPDDAAESAKREQTQAALDQLLAEQSAESVKGSAKKEYRLPKPLDHIDCDVTALAEDFEIIRTRIYGPGDFHVPTLGRIVDCEVVVWTLKAKKKIVSNELLLKGPLGDSYRVKVKFYKEIVENGEVERLKVDEFMIFDQPLSEPLAVGETCEVWTFLEERGSRSLLKAGATKMSIFWSR